MSYSLARTDAEIDDLIGDTIDAEVNGSKFRGMSYEEGIRAAVDWITGTTDDNPMNDE